MSEFINESPNVLDASQLPTRKVDDIEDSIYTNKISPKLATCSQWKQLNSTITDKDSAIFNIFSNASDLLDLQDIISYSKKHTTVPETTDVKSTDRDQLDPQEIYDLIAHISDPEHPLTLGQLSVVNLADIDVIDQSDKNTKMGEIIVKITPTITHCSLATLIGLGIRVRLERSLSSRFRITILLKKGTHQSENQVNKQLNDKERVAAACENEQLLGVVSKMLSTCK